MNRTIRGLPTLKRLADSALDNLVFSIMNHTDNYDYSRNAEVLDIEDSPEVNRAKTYMMAGLAGAALLAFTQVSNQVSNFSYNQARGFPVNIPGLERKVETPPAPTQKVIQTQYLSREQVKAQHPDYAHPLSTIEQESLYRIIAMEGSDLVSDKERLGIAWVTYNRMLDNCFPGNTITDQVLAKGQYDPTSHPRTEHIFTDLAQGKINPLDPILNFYGLEKGKPISESSRKAVSSIMRGDKDPTDKALYFDHNGALEGTQKLCPAPGQLELTKTIGITNFYR